MEIIRDIPGLRHYIEQLKTEKKSIGFVPTMGALHNGHLELIRKSGQQNDLTICSIFVNPTQFNNPSDLKNYPRESTKDLALLEEINCHAVFMPSVKIMYEENYSINLDFGYLEKIMEGKFRPGHFKGVGLIVTKLFNLIQPSKAYFGRKDLQQLTLIKTLVKELFFDIEIVAVDTIREKDGLAMSSRNNLLTKQERKKATDLFRALLEAKQKLNNGESVITVKHFIKEYFTLKSSIVLEYFEIVHTSNFKNVTEIHEKSNVSLCIAGYLGKVRLIDNISLI